MIRVSCQLCGGSGKVTETDWHSGYEVSAICGRCRGSGTVEDKSIQPLSSKVESLAKWLFVKELPAGEPHGQLFLIGAWTTGDFAEKYRRRAREIINYLEARRGDLF